MIDRINNLIEVNLILLLNSKNNSLNLNDFEDDSGNKFQDAETFARLMQIKKLITNNPEEKFCFQLTEFGTEICKNGGWLEYLKTKKVVENNTEKRKSKNSKRKLIIAILLIIFFFIITFYNLTLNKK